MGNIRMFIAINIGTQQSLISLEKKLKKIEPSLRCIESQNIHLTLKFLGDTDESYIPHIKKVMIQSVKGKKPFHIKLKGIGVFPNLNYIKIIWVGIKIINADSSILSNIAQKINDGLFLYGFPKDKKLLPHITISRVKRLENRKKLQTFIINTANSEFGIIEATHITLKKSTLTPHGPIYENLVRIKI
jgi:2'-5' RNA ligase